MQRPPDDPTGVLSLAARIHLPQPRILVAGLGNFLMGDDGVGVHACRAWLAERPAPRHLLVAEVGTAIYASLHLLEWADRILVIDAMQAGGAPGTLYLAEPRELEVNRGNVSLHDLSLLGALSILKDRRPRQVQVLGIEPASLALGTELSGPVARALPELVREAKRIVGGEKSGLLTIDPDRQRSSPLLHARAGCRT